MSSWKWTSFSVRWQSASHPRLFSVLSQWWFGGSEIFFFCLCGCSCFHCSFHPFSLLDESDVQRREFVSCLGKQGNLQALLLPWLLPLRQSSLRFCRSATTDGCSCQREPHLQVSYFPGSIQMLRKRGGTESTKIEALSEIKERKTLSC